MLSPRTKKKTQDPRARNASCDHDSKGDPLRKGSAPPTVRSAVHRNRSQAVPATSHVRAASESPTPSKPVLKRTNSSPVQIKPADVEKSVRFTPGTKPASEQANTSPKPSPSAETQARRNLFARSNKGVREHSPVSPQQRKRHSRTPALTSPPDTKPLRSLSISPRNKKQTLQAVQRERDKLQKSLEEYRELFSYQEIQILALKEENIALVEKAYEADLLRELCNEQYPKPSSQLPPRDFGPLPPASEVASRQDLLDRISELEARHEHDEQTIKRLEDQLQLVIAELKAVKQARTRRSETLPQPSILGNQ